MANLFEVHDERTEENFSGPMVEITDSSNRDIYKKNQRVSIFEDLKIIQIK